VILCALCGSSFSTVDRAYFPKVNPRKTFTTEGTEDQIVKVLKCDIAVAWLRYPTCRSLLI
jgi:hypothetical protein